MKRQAAAEQTHIWTIWWPGATKQGRQTATAIPITLCDSPVDTVKSLCFPGTIIIIQELKWELNISSMSTTEDVLPGEVQPAKVNNDALRHRRHWVHPQSKSGTRGGCSGSFCSPIPIFHWARLRRTLAPKQPPKLTLVILDNACDSTRCTGTFQKHPRGVSPLCSAENMHLVYFWWKPRQATQSRCQAGSQTPEQLHWRGALFNKWIYSA